MKGKCNINVSPYSEKSLVFPTSIKYKRLMKCICHLKVASYPRCQIKVKGGRNVYVALN